MDDDALARAVLEEILVRLGHDCRVAPDGEAAFRLLQEVDADVVLSDWNMPRMDGLELCRRLRAQGRLHRPYFILTSATTDRAQALRVLDVGGNEFLAKPIDELALQIRLADAARVLSLIPRTTAAATAAASGRVAELARIDPLTGLGNALRLREDLDALQARAERYGRGFGYALCDVDGMAAYNGAAGRLAGDEVLVAVADLLRTTIRRGDGLFRVRDDEFAVILPEQTLASTLTALERVRVHLAGHGIPHPAREPGAHVTLSVGVAAFAPPGTPTARSVPTRAAEALARARAEGGDRVVAHPDAD